MPVDKPDADLKIPIATLDGVEMKTWEIALKQLKTILEDKPSVKNKTSDPEEDPKLQTKMRSCQVVEILLTEVCDKCCCAKSNESIIIKARINKISSEFQL